MPGNKEKGKSKQARRADEWAKKRRGVNWDLVWKILASVFAFAGSMVAVYELVNYFRSDAKTFYSIIFPGLGIIVWFAILIQLFRKKNPYAILLLIVTVLGGVVGGVGWQSYNQTQEDKLIVLVAQFDGPEDEYHLRDEILKQLRETTSDYPDTEIIPLQETITEAQGSEYAREIGKKEHADLVIWAWYTKTEKSNLNLYVENLAPNDFKGLNTSEIYQPQVALANFESLEVQQQLGSETSSLVTFLGGYLRYKSHDYETARIRFTSALQEENPGYFVPKTEILSMLGECYSKLGDIDQAIKNLDQAILLEPDSGWIYNDRGSAYLRSNQYDKAIDDYTQAIILEPDDPSAYVNRGWTYYKLGQLDKAVNDINQAILLNPEYAVAYDIRGFMYLFQGQDEKAINCQGS